MSQEYWDKNDELDLVRFVNFAKDSEAVEQLLTQAREESDLPNSGYDFLKLGNPRRELIQKIYNALCQKKIEYDLNEYIQTWNHNPQQKIRTAEDILQTKSKGTCLDLAVLFGAICIHFDLLPILILLDGHALAAVSLTHSYRDWKNAERKGQELFWKSQGILKSKNELKKLLKKEYLAVECTGFSRSETLSENGDFARKDGLLSFEQAVALGKKIVEQRELFCTLDTSTAYHFWVNKIFKERLNQDLPKSFNNDKDLLKDIYVSLGLIERKKQAKPRLDGDSVNPKNSLNQPDGDNEVVKEYKNNEFFDEILKNHDRTNTQGKRLLVIGDPGAGKTTLLQKIAHWILEEKQGLPIWISLAKFNEDLVKVKDINDPGWLYRHLSEQWLRDLSQEGKKTPQKWQDKFDVLLKTRQLWLIFDGADEMAVSYPLKKIQEQLSKGWVSSVQVVMSCRLNLWEQQKDTLNEKFKIYRTLDFTYPEQVHQFINNWFGEGEKSNKLQETLKEENRERLQNLIKNPLRLALLCRIWSDGIQELPETKAGFYQFLVDDYYQWRNDTNKKFEILSEEKKVLRKDLNIALGKLAREAIDNSNFRFRLREDYIKNRLSFYFPKENRGDILFGWAIKLGWLLDIGYPTEEEKNRAQKIYAFFHPTFQEYFAATAVENYDFFLPKEHKNKPVKDKQYRIFEPQWKEVILLWLGRSDVDKNEKEAFIRALVEFEDGCGELLRKAQTDKSFYEYRAYFLAAAGIAEFKNCSRADEIVEKIIQLSFSYSDKKQEQQGFLWVSEQGRAALQETKRTTAISALVKLIDKTNDTSTLGKIAENLGRIGVGSETAISALVKLIDKTNDPSTLREIAASLGKIGKGNNTAIAGLRILLEVNHEHVSKRAYSSLEQIGSDNEIAISALVEILERTNDDESTTLEKIAKILGEIGTGNETAISALAELLQRNNYKSIRLRIAKNLGEIGTGNKIAVHALEQLLKSTKNESTREHKDVAEILLKIDPGNKTAIKELVNLLKSIQDDEDRGVYRVVVKSLEKTTKGNKFAISALEELLKSLLESIQVNVEPCMLLARSLREIDPSNKTVIDVSKQLLELTKDTEDKFIFKEATFILSKMDLSNENTISALVNLIDSGKYQHEVYKTLEQIGKDNKTAISALEKLLKLTENEFMRRRISEIIGEIAPGNKTAIATWLELLESTDSKSTRERKEIAEKLLKVDPGNKTAIKELVKLLYPIQYQFDLSQTVDLLEKIEKNKLVAIEELEKLLEPSQTHDESTRMLTAKVLGKISPGNKTAIATLLELLESIQDNKDFFFYSKVLGGLGEIGTGNKSVISALEKLLKSTDNKSTRERKDIAENLLKVDPGNKTAIKELVKLLYSSQDQFDRSQVANLLEKMGKNNIVATEELEKPLESSQTHDESTRMLAAKVLGKISPGNKTAIATLLELLGSIQDNKDFLFYSDLVDSLGEIGICNELVISALVTLLEKTKAQHTLREIVAKNLIKIGKGNKIPISALVELFKFESTRKLATESLIEIGQSNKAKEAIVALEKLLEPSQTQDKSTRRRASEILGKIDPGNKKAVEVLLEQLKSSQAHAASSLREILSNQDHAQVVVKLKNLLSDSQELNYDCYHVIWDCAQNMTYPTFYEAWQSTKQTLDLANLPQILTDKTVKDSNLRDKVQLIFIDGSKFIDRDNPASKIYTEIVKGGCARSEDGTPKTMPELQAYWDLLTIDSDRYIVLIFYENPTEPNPKGFSEVFLDALSTFEGAICIITEQSIDVNSLQWFTSSDTVEDIMAWISQEYISIGV